MKIHAVSSMPLLTISMEVGEKINSDGGVMVYEINNGVRGFFTFMSRAVANKISVGDTIKAVCNPVKDLSFGKETFAVLKRVGERRWDLVFGRRDFADLLITH